MRLLAFSDLHNDVAAARRLADRARLDGVDGLLSAGDLALLEEGEDRMYDALQSTGLPVWSVPGNHDGDEPYREIIARYGWTDIDGRSVLLGQTCVAGWGLRHAYRPSYASNPEEQEEDSLLEMVGGQLAGTSAARRLLVSHVPPFGTRAALEKGRFRGNVQLRRLAEQLSLTVVCGHVHHPQVVLERLGEGRIVNAGPHGHVVDLG